jgi:hypothetical protein
MMSTVKDKIVDAGKAVGDAAKAVGQKVVEAGANAVDFVKDKTGIGHGKDVGVSGIKEHMPVYSSCGCKVGVVHHLDGDKIKLTKSDSPDGQHHFIPTAWVDRVDSHVHLTKNADECKTAMKSEGGSCCGA